MGLHMDEKNKEKNDTILEGTESNETDLNEEPSWFDRNKKKIKYGLWGLGVATLTALGLKNKDMIKTGLKSLGSPVSKDTAKAVTDGMVHTATRVKSIIPEGFKLSGKRLTPTGLGDIMGCSAQEINKRLINAGLAKRCINSEMDFTELGKGLGEMVWKVTKAGHSFVNIEWDEAILHLIFSVEEIAKRKEMQAKATEIMADI